MKNANTNTATYTKLRSGDWGIRVQGEATAGQQITVEKKSGERKVETIATIVWAGNGVTLCAIAKNAGVVTVPAYQRYSNTKRGGRRTGCSCGSVEEYSKDSDCWQCRHDAE